MVGTIRKGKKNIRTWIRRKIERAWMIKAMRVEVITKIVKIWNVQMKSWPDSNLKTLKFSKALKHLWLMITTIRKSEKAISTKVVRTFINKIWKITEMCEIKIRINLKTLTRFLRKIKAGGN